MRTSPRTTSATPPPEEEEGTEEAAQDEAAAGEEHVGHFATQNGEVAVRLQRDYEAPGMKLEEAVLQLDLMEDREFFVFTNADSGSINIVYKRDDGNIGLIET